LLFALLEYVVELGLYPFHSLRTIQSKSNTQMTIGTLELS